MREHSYAKNDYVISRAIRKHGWNNFTTSVLLETENKDYAYKQAEAIFIAKFSSNDPNKGYNSTIGGEGSPGFRFSDETKEIMRTKKQGKKLSTEHRMKISENNKGRIFSTETRKKISEALRGNKNFQGKCVSNEHRRKLSEANSKTWTFIDPNGELVSILNLREFCLKNSLHPSAMSRVAHGKQTTHKGWKAVRHVRLSMLPGIYP